jgi:peptide-methionine (S)-S-oxide reductase
MSKFATFGAGCFWGVEVAFRAVDGVIDTAVGYAGGHQPNPSYPQVCTGSTGHAEVVQVEYDPETVSYDELLNTFLSVHDPHIQEKAQYRSVIFYHDDEQKQLAERLVRAENGERPLATAVEPAPTFYRAEEYHQQYLAKRGVA